MSGEKLIFGCLNAVGWVTRKAPNLEKY